MKTSRLIAAIRTGDRAEVLAALRGGADVEEADMHGFPGLPLRTACFTGNTAIVGDLIKHGADVNAAGSDGPSAPLRLARRRGHDDIFGLLLKHGAQVPPDVSAPQPALDVALPPLEFSAAPAKAPPPPAAEQPSAGLEFTLPDAAAGDDADFGEQTRLIGMDLLFEEEETAPAISGSQPVNPDGSIDFWPPPRRSHD